ncbi:DUF5106 domain-containing protein [Runella sp. MFBS21]|uniref:DUF5106 domain-containing protein n=1 Tax=Runella sp. MFBS21 TaxID=3034018 RepID=UPI0023F64A7F|nr:DUF5106 domain-containing protein [Runella sp. MFBS21]MDF7816510.1 DUF5106 domain-containing protein [Runella sp. MFBS21]
MSQEVYRIEGVIRGITDGNCILAYNHYSSQLYAKDTAKVDKTGRIIFSKNEKLDTGIYEILLPNRNKTISLIISDAQQFSFSTDTSDIIEKMKIMNSHENKLFYDFQKFMKVNQEKYKEAKLSKNQNIILDERKVFYEKFINKNKGYYVTKLLKTAADTDISNAPKLPNGSIDSTKLFEYYKAHYWDNFDFSDTRLAKTPFLHQKLERYIKNLTIQREDSIIKSANQLINKAQKGYQKDFVSYIISYITNQYEIPKIMGTEGVFVHMVENYYLTEIITLNDTSTLKALKEKISILKPLLLNREIPNIGVQNIRGSFSYIYELNGDFNVIFFYSPSCGHCKEAAPKLKSFYDKYRNYGVQVMPISIEGSEEDWKKFISDNKWQNLANGYGLTVSRKVDYRKDYDAISTPTIYIVDKNHKIIARRIGVEDLEPFYNLHSKDNPLISK